MCFQLNVVFIDCLLCLILDNRAWWIGVLNYAHGIYVLYCFLSGTQTWHSCSGFSATCAGDTRPSGHFMHTWGAVKCLVSGTENGSGSQRGFTARVYSMSQAASVCTSTSTLSSWPSFCEKHKDIYHWYIFLIKTHVIWTKEGTINRTEKSRQACFMLLQKKVNNKKT